MVKLSKVRDNQVSIIRSVNAALQACSADNASNAELANHWHEKYESCETDKKGSDAKLVNLSADLDVCLDYWQDYVNLLSSNGSSATCETSLTPVFLDGYISKSEYNNVADFASALVENNQWSGYFGENRVTSFMDLYLPTPAQIGVGALVATPIILSVWVPLAFDNYKANAILQARVNAFENQPDVVPQGEPAEGAANNQHGGQLVAIAKNVNNVYNQVSMANGHNNQAKNLLDGILGALPTTREPKWLVKLLPQFNDLDNHIQNTHNALAPTLGGDGFISKLYAGLDNFYQALYGQEWNAEDVSPAFGAGGLYGEAAVNGAEIY